MASENGYQVSLVDRAEVAAAGFVVKTDMAKARIDCPNLWKMFGPHMAAFPADARFAGESYGISADADRAAGAFFYWAAMPLAPGEEPPRGMKATTLPAGTYCVCPLPGVADISPAIEFLEKEWLAQAGYEFDPEGVFFELYGPDYMTSGRLAVYCKVRRTQK